VSLATIGGVSETPDPSADDVLGHLGRAVDVILEAVENAPTGTPGTPVRDANDTLLCAAYGRAYRCLRSIRELAGRGEADDALVLTRALVSLVARSLWLASPDDPAERKVRLDRARRSWAEEAVKTARDLRSVGFEPEGEERAQALLDQLEQVGVACLPDDRSLLVALNLEAFYPRVHRRASDVTHFSLGAALEGFLERPDQATGTGGVVSLRLPDPTRAYEALYLAVVTFGAFLERSEQVIGHGLTENAMFEFASFLRSEEG
jgi:hypothetical protein